YDSRPTVFGQSPPDAVPAPPDCSSPRRPLHTRTGTRRPDASSDGSLTEPYPGRSDDFPTADPAPPPDARTPLYTRVRSVAIAVPSTASPHAATPRRGD